jgi:hypothetical protein
MAYLVGLDIGQMQDYTAVALIERVQDTPKQPTYDMRYNPSSRQHTIVEAQPGPARYLVHHLQRFELRTPYPIIVERVQAMLQRPELGGKAELLLDVTGVGRGVLDMFHEAKLYPLAISIHGGSNTTHQGREWHVPKKDLVYSLTALSQARPVRLALGERLPFAAEVKAEMQTFTARINPETAHESFAAWREQSHDDLLLAMAMACWWGERQAQYAAGVWGR